MKDHLSMLNPLSGSTPNRTPESANFRTNTQNPLSPWVPGKEQTGNSISESRLDDSYEARIKGGDGFNEANIDDIDFAMAMEYTKFIREQALSPEGRNMMSLAHQTVTPQQVVQMFRMA